MCVCVQDWRLLLFNESHVLSLFISRHMYFHPLATQQPHLSMCAHWMMLSYIWMFCITVSKNLNVAHIILSRVVVFSSACVCARVYGSLCMCRNWFVDSKYFVSMTLCLLWNVLKMNTQTPSWWVFYVDRRFLRTSHFTLHVYMWVRHTVAHSCVGVAIAMGMAFNAFVERVLPANIFISLHAPLSHLLYSISSVYILQAFKARVGSSFTPILSPCTAIAFSQCTHSFSIRNEQKTVNENET